MLSMKYTSPMDPISIGKKPILSNYSWSLFHQYEIEKHPGNVKHCQNGMSFSFFWASFHPLEKSQVSIHQCFSFPKSNGGNRSCCIRTYAWDTS